MRVELIQASTHTRTKREYAQLFNALASLAHSISSGIQLWWLVKRRSVSHVCVCVCDVTLTRDAVRNKVAYVHGMRVWRQCLSSANTQTQNRSDDTNRIKMRSYVSVTIHALRRRRRTSWPARLELCATPHSHTKQTHTSASKSCRPIRNVRTIAALSEYIMRHK